MSQVLIFASLHVLTPQHSPEGFHLLQILRSYLELDLYSSLMVQTDKTIDATVAELLKFGELINVGVN